MINLISIGMASYNFRAHVASDIPTNGYYIPSVNTKTQQYLQNISRWTKENKMELNTSKSKVMIFNFTKEFQVSSRLELKKEGVEIIQETKLLGVMVNNKLNWDSNTAFLVRKSNSRMRILHKLVEFGIPIEDLVTIYVLYIRSILEQSCQVWHSSLSLENIQDLERVQKNALKIILQDEYFTYSTALNTTGLSTLFGRRKQLCLKFAKSCLKNLEMKTLFPLNNVPSNMKTRYREKFQVMPARTERLKNSAVPYMQRLLNTAANMK